MRQRRICRSAPGSIVSSAKRSPSDATTTIKLLLNIALETRRIFEAAPMGARPGYSWAFIGRDFRPSPPGDCSFLGDVEHQVAAVTLARKTAARSTAPSGPVLERARARGRVSASSRDVRFVASRSIGTNESTNAVAGLHRTGREIGASGRLDFDTKGAAGW